MPKFIMGVNANETKVITARLGAGTGAANWLSDADVGKAVKLAGESRYDLCAAGDEIEGFITSVETGTHDNFTVGGVQVSGNKNVICDGSQAAGTGNLAVGDYVVAGAVTAKGTTLGSSYVKVRKATDQAAAKASPFALRVVSLGEAGTGAVGTRALVQRVGIVG